MTTENDNKPKAPMFKGIAMIKGAVPETEEELVELLSDKAVADHIFADEELRVEFLAKHVKARDKARPDVQRMITDGVQKGLRASMIEMGVNRPDVSQNVDGERKMTRNYSDYAPGAVLDKEFKNTTDFMLSVFHVAIQNEIKATERWRKIRNDYSTIDPSGGGFLVPEVLRAELLRLSLESGVVRPRARVIPMEAKTIRFPTVDSSSHATSVFGGVIGYWTEEGASITESQAVFGSIELAAQKLTAYSEAPNELLQDSPISFGAFIDQSMPAALANFEDRAFMNGSGTGEPLGVRNANALVTVTKETNQVADTIVWENLVKIYARMLPQSVGNAVWVANMDCFPELATMALSVGTGGSAIWLQNGVDSPPASILGRPLILSEKMATLGDAEDIGFFDFSYYLIGDRMEMRVMASEHSAFQSDKTAFRIIERVDGRPWLQSALTPQNGTNTLSPYVVLGART